MTFRERARKILELADALDAPRRAFVRIWGGDDDAPTERDLPPWWEERVLIDHKRLCRDHGIHRYTRPRRNRTLKAMGVYNEPLTARYYAAPGRYPEYERRNVP